MDIITPYSAEVTAGSMTINFQNTFPPAECLYSIYVSVLAIKEATVFTSIKLLAFVTKIRCVREIRSEFSIFYVGCEDYFGCGSSAYLR